MTDLHVPDSLSGANTPGPWLPPVSLGAFLPPALVPQDSKGPFQPLPGPQPPLLWAFSGSAPRVLVRLVLVTRPAVVVMTEGTWILEEKVVTVLGGGRVGTC